MTSPPSTHPGARSARTRRRPRPTTVVLGLVVVGLAAMWIYAFFFASSTPPDRIADDAWSARAEAVCARYDEQLEELPPAAAFADVEPRAEALRRRADVVERSNELLRAMLAELRADRPADDESAARVGAWLDAYGTYVGDRDDHVARWRAGRDEQFAETARDGRPQSLYIDAFARANRMRACEVPQDIG